MLLYQSLLCHILLACYGFRKRLETFSAKRKETALARQLEQDFTIQSARDLNTSTWGRKCSDVIGAEARDSEVWPDCKCSAKRHVVYCQGEVVIADRKFNAIEDVMRNPKCQRPMCGSKWSTLCEFIGDAMDNQHGKCGCKKNGHSVYCLDEVVSEGRDFDPKPILSQEKCARALCAAEKTCAQVEGAEDRNSEDYPLCKCKKGFESVQCGETLVADRKFNAKELFQNPICTRPVCTTIKRVCATSFMYDPVDKYIDEMRQGRPEDPFDVQMVSISNRINNLATPVAGWNLVKHWDFGGMNRCEFVQQVGIYRREGQCALTFSSLEHASDLSTNFNLRTRKWCGFTDMQKGYADRLDEFIYGHRFAEFKDFLNNPEECPKGVVGVGHSMGGALVTMMAVCANQQSYFKIEELYTVATPGVSKKNQLVNIHDKENGCFKGFRMYNMDYRFRDPIPAMSAPFGYLHPKLAEKRITQLEDSTFEIKEHACTDPHARDHPEAFANFKVSNPGLHPATVYVKRLLKIHGVLRENTNGTVYQCQEAEMTHCQESQKDPPKCKACYPNLE